MTLQILWLGISLMLINEGLSLAISPERWRKMIQRLNEQTDETLRRLGFMMGVIAVVLGAGLKRLFPDLFGVIWLAVSVMILTEGVIISTIPSIWREKMIYMTEQSDSVLRRLGMIMLAFGLGLWLASY